MNRFFSNSIAATFYCIALLFAIYTPSFSQPIYLKTLSPARGNAFTQNMHSVIPLAGNKLMFFCNSNQLGNSKLLVATTDETCTMQSSFHHGIENSDLITYRSVMAADSTIFTCGSVKNYSGAPDYYVYLSKMTTQGVMLWEKSFMVTGMGSTLTAAYDMVLLPDTSVILGGVTGSPKRSLLMRVDKNGNLMWDQNYTGISNGWITALAYHPGGDLVVSGIDSLVILPLWDLGRVAIK